jgi:hypothetical protein
MAKVLCPCGCGESFEPIVHGSKQKYFSPQCGNRFRVRRARLKRKRVKKQRALQFQPGQATGERRKKNRAVEEPLFA